MADSFFFFQQKSLRIIPKRFRKLPEDLPESLKFAHLNPKAAAYLASKEKQKQEEDLFGDGLGKKSLMPEISQAFMSIKNRLDSSLSNDEDSQRYLFEQACANAATVLMQLAKIIYSYEDIASHIPKSLEYNLMCGSKELTADVTVVPREWQTHAMKEACAKNAAVMAQSDDEGDLGGGGSGTEDGRPRAPSIISAAGDTSRGKKRILSKGGLGLPEITEDSTALEGQTGQLTVPRGHNGSRLSISSHAGLRRDKRHIQTDKNSVVGAGFAVGRSPATRRGIHEYDLMSAFTDTASDNRSTAMTNPSYYMSVIQFQLSSKLCEEKGWIVQKGREDELAKEAVLEWCFQILRQAQKIILEQKAQEKEMGYDSPVQIRYYGDTRKETLLKYRKSPVKSVVNPALKGGKPLIPNMHDDQNDGKQLMLTGHLDGTTVAYYPSGRPAIVSSGAGFGRLGFYTIAYDDDPDSKMLACFTPFGNGVCYHSNGNIRFLAHRKGGCLAESNGRLERKWKWTPGGVKITTPVGFQVNPYISFRCVSELHMVLFFNCQKETARFPVHAAAGAGVRYTSDENDRLNRQLAELVKAVDTQERSLYDTEADKELARLQRKTRNLIDDWMEHYRLAIGLQSPHLSAMPDSPTRIRQRRQTQSAKPLDGDKTEQWETKSMDHRETSSRPVRAPSAPAATPRQRGGSARSKVLLATARSKVPSPVPRSVTPMVKFEGIAETQPPVEEASARDDDQDLTASIIIPKFAVDLLHAKSASQLTRPLVRQETAASLPDHDLLPNLTLCPAALHQVIVNQSRPQCRCSRHAIPTIRDVEYDRYITKEAPASQLQIIMVHSSLHPNTNPAETMINHIYATQNRNRTRPCLQSRTETFRILKYDINTATEDCTHTQPLLLTRHNVVPGMFLIYAGGKLLFCDHILNGYGFTQKDFRKQVMKSRYDFLHGQSLPSDFRFSPSKGCHGLRSAWGGEIGGTGVDSFGSPGTALDRSLSDVPVSDKPVAAANPHAAQLSELSKSLRNLLALKALDSSEVPSLPPITLPQFQELGVHSKGFKREPVRLGLPSLHSFVVTEISQRGATRANRHSSARMPDKVAAQ